MEIQARRQLIRANSRLSITISASEMVGPAISGYLLQVASAAATTVVDAITYGTSAVSFEVNLSGLRGEGGFEGYFGKGSDEWLDYCFRIFRMM